MELKIVNYEQAKRLKMVGFNYRCNVYYNGEDSLRYFDYFKDFNHPNCMVGRNPSSAPTVALALKWFREEKCLFGNVGFDKTVNGITHYFCTRQGIEPARFETYEAAESALLDCLLNLKLTKEELERLWVKCEANTTQAFNTLIKATLGKDWQCTRYVYNSVTFSVIDKNGNPVFGQDIEIRRDIRFGNCPIEYTTNIGSCGEGNIEKADEVGDRAFYYASIGKLLSDKTVIKKIKDLMTDAATKIDEYKKEINDLKE
jgi:hypothetical protein